MAKEKIAAIYRTKAYSPNNVKNDAAILTATCRHLEDAGYGVTSYSEEELQRGAVSERVIVDMCREWDSVERLKEYGLEGRLVINSGFGIENCTRERMTRMLVEAGIPYPESLIVDTTCSVADMLSANRFHDCWVKRGDKHAMHKEDVAYARKPDEVQEILEEYDLRGIKRAVINRHIKGDLIKFYGVAGSDFFYWFYPFDVGHSKYGHEAVNGKSRGLGFDAEGLRRMCESAGDVLDVKVYGGDCIVPESGTPVIIDFNDWPTFAPCRAEGSAAIAAMLMNNIERYRDER